MNFEKRLAGVTLGEEVLRASWDVRERRMNEAACAIVDGHATLDQYNLLCDRDVRQALKRWTPTITLGFARRHLGLEVGWRNARAWLSYLPGDVLAHPPGDALGQDLQDQMGCMDDLWRDASQSIQVRLAAAQARLTVGHADGRARRTDLWSGKGKKRARRKLCDQQQWRNAGLLGVWDELGGLLLKRVAEQGGEVAPEHYLIAPYEVFERLMWETYGT